MVVTVLLIRVGHRIWVIRVEVIASLWALKHGRVNLWLLTGLKESVPKHQESRNWEFPPTALSKQGL